MGRYLDAKMFPYHFSKQQGSFCSYRRLLAGLLVSSEMKSMQRRQGTTVLQYIMLVIIIINKKGSFKANSLVLSCIFVTSMSQASISFPIYWKKGEKKPNNNNKKANPKYIQPFSSFSTLTVYKSI